jgi:hypothetical protein
MRRHSLLVWLVTLVSIPAVSAESQVGGTGLPSSANSVIAFDPILLPFGNPMMELETRVGWGFTLGGSASYINIAGDRYTSVETKLRYYPGGVVLQGFSMGLTAGWLRFSDMSGTISAPTVSIVADYNWMLGERRGGLKKLDS